MPSTGQKKLEQQARRRALAKAQEQIEGQKVPDNNSPGPESDAPPSAGESSGLPANPKLSPEKADGGDVTPTGQGPDTPPADKPKAPDLAEQTRLAVARAVLGWFRLGGGIYIMWRIKQLKLPPEKAARVEDRVQNVFVRKLGTGEGTTEALQNCYQVAIVLEQEAPTYFKMLATPGGQLGAVFGWVMDIKQTIDSEIEAAKVA